MKISSSLFYFQDKHFCLQCNGRLFQSEKRGKMGHTLKVETGINTDFNNSGNGIKSAFKLLEYDAVKQFYYFQIARVKQMGFWIKNLLCFQFKFQYQRQRGCYLARRGFLFCDILIRICSSKQDIFIHLNQDNSPIYDINPGIYPNFQLSLTDSG